MSGHLNAYATQVAQNKTQVWFAPKVDPSQMIVMGGHAQISAKKQSKQSPYRLDSTKRLSKNDHNKQSNHDLHMLDPMLTLTSPGIHPPKIDSDTRRSQETLQGTILGKREIEAISETAGKSNVAVGEGQVTAGKGEVGARKIPCETAGECAARGGIEEAR